MPEPDPSTGRAPSGDATAAGDDDPATTLLTRGFGVVLVVAAVVGVVVSLAAWCFLELTYQTQRELCDHLPSALDYHDGSPIWWSLPILAAAGVIVALVISRMPGSRDRARGAADRPRWGAGVAVVKLARRQAPPQLLVVVGAAGSFAALSFVFSSPIIAAIILIEATGLGRSRLPIVLIPGLVGAGIGTLVSIKMGSFTGLSTSAYALAALPLPIAHHPTFGNFAWTVALGLAVALIAYLIRTGGLFTQRLAKPRPLVMLPLCRLAVSGLAIAFSQATGKGVNGVLSSGHRNVGQSGRAKRSRSAWRSRRWSS